MQLTKQYRSDKIYSVYRTNAVSLKELSNYFCFANLEVDHKLLYSLTKQSLKNEANKQRMYL